MIRSLLGKSPTRFTAEEIEACVSGVEAKRDGLVSLREYDGFLTENWYIACLSRDLDEAEKGLYATTIYETPLVLFRESAKLGGKVLAVLDRCLHRGAKLSQGICHDGKLKCPYHGWTYGAEGVVCDVPSQGPLQNRKSERLQSFSAIERDGVVWVWMGRRPPVTDPAWRFPYSEDPSWAGYFMVTDFHNEVTNLVENFMDVPHTVFVHKKWFRNAREMRVPITVELGRGRVLVTYDQPNDSIGFSSRVLNPGRHPMIHTDEFIFPNITRVDYQFGDRGYVINSQCTPMGRYRTRVYTWIAYRLFPGKVGRALQELLLKPMEFYTRQVIEQDVDIMLNQGINLWRLDEQGRGVPFRSTSADELHLAIERLRELGRAGDARVETINWAKEREIWI